MNSKVGEIAQCFSFSQSFEVLQNLFKTKMGRKKIQMEEKSRALTLLEKRDSLIAVARDIGVSRGNWSIKKVSGVIATRDGSEEEVRLWRT